MSGDGWLTLVVVAVAVVAMARDIVAPAVAVLGGTVLLLLSGVISTGEAFSGFSNPCTAHDRRALRARGSGIEIGPPPTPRLVDARRRG